MEQNQKQDQKQKIDQPAPQAGEKGQPSQKVGNLPDIEAQTGAIGYILAWLLGVPASVLLLIFLIRGH